LLHWPRHSNGFFLLGGGFSVGVGELGGTVLGEEFEDLAAGILARPVGEGLLAKVDGAKVDFEGNQVLDHLKVPLLNRIIGGSLSVQVDDIGVSPVRHQETGDRDIASRDAVVNWILPIAVQVVHVEAALYQHFDHLFVTFSYGIVQGRLFERIVAGGDFETILHQDLYHSEREVFVRDLCCTVKCVLVEARPISGQAGNVHSLREVHYLFDLTLLDGIEERSAHLLLLWRHHFVALLGQWTVLLLFRDWWCV